MEQDSLRTWEAKCIQEEPPKCKAACPLHVNSKDVCKFLASGQIDKAWAVLCKTMPFPAITARICDGPCRTSCLREEVGGGIELNALEKFCAENTKKTPQIRPLPPRNKTIAVLGAFLPGLAAAWDLGKKGFTVKIFCQNRFDAFENIPEGLLSKEIFNQELETLQRLDVTFSEDHTANPELITETLDKFDAVFVDPLFCPAETLNISTPDSVTLKTEINGLFAEVSPEVDISPIALIAKGRKGALSIERSLQNASLSAGRERENIFESNLYTNISKTVHIPPVCMPQQGYNEAQAREEASRCLLCECMECVKNCVYLEEFKGYPKSFARQIYNNASIVMGTRMANNLINSCMLCDLCTELCPNDFSMKTLCLEARQDLVEKGHMPPSAHEFALQDMDFADSASCALVLHQAGTKKSKRVFFP